MTAEQQSLLDDVLADEDVGFSGWEMDLLESLDKQRACDLSEKQVDRLGELARKAKLID